VARGRCKLVVMDTGSAQKASDDADTFEAFADDDFKVNRVHFPSA
jgi:hypothetical protein